MNINSNAIATDSNLDIEGLFTEGFSQFDGWIDEMCQQFLKSNDSCDSMPVNELKTLFTDTNIPTQQQQMGQYLDEFQNHILPYCSHLASPTYVGHMTSPLPNFVSQLSRLVMILNQNMMKIESCRGLNFLERQVLAMLHKEVFHLNEKDYQQSVQDSNLNFGCFTSGGTVANITAMWVARNQRQQSLDISESRGVIIGSELMHYSFDKAADLLGLELIRIPVDEEYCISLPHLKEALKEVESKGQRVTAMVAIAGTTDFGSVDPIADMAELAHAQGAYLHVDGAWGGAMVLCDEGKVMLSDIHLADSVTIDGHKQLMTPIGCGLLLTREVTTLGSIRKEAPYAIRSSSLDQGRFTLEGTRPAMALYLHAAFHLIGKSGYNDLLSKSLARARVLAQILDDKQEFELVHSPKMNLMVYRYLPDGYRNRRLTESENEYVNWFNVALQKRQRSLGNTFVSRTKRTTNLYPGQALVLFRAVMLNPLTTDVHLETVVNDQLSIAEMLEKEVRNQSLNFGEA
ncbi:aminotransferase class V-fold PLP-dependent enzyme [Vibrio caribbeanicus]|uniref:aminotransferase class V-fold PLP-dependent enzyme n=1 Tax=Vibrio caribbeanicus TaxID=701175 RepID=UPI0030DB995F